MQHETSVIVDCSEVDRLASLKRRVGSTLMPTLRDGWMGDELGAGNSEMDRRLRVAQHAYRLAFIIGVQPKRGAALLGPDEEAGGRPQRLLWLPGTDRFVPDVDILRALIRFRKEGAITVVATATGT